MHTYRCETDLALTYALRHPALALICARHALTAAHSLGRPDLVYAANELIANIGR